MKNLSFLLMFVTFFCASAIAQNNVAVLEIERRASVADEISRDEAMEITNVIRSEAVRTLPAAQFNIMTSETVQSMSGAVLADCADESCIITIGRRIDAEYIVRGTLSKFQTMFTLNVEMFETEYGNLIATADPIRSENLIEILNKSATACSDMYRKFMARMDITPAQAVAPPTPAPAPAAPPPPMPVTYTLTIRNVPPVGGTVTRNPDLPRYNAGTQVTMTAISADNYRFTGWSANNSKAMLSTNPTLQGTMNSDMTFTANYKALPPPRPLKPEPVARASRSDNGSPLKLTMQISTGALAVGGIIGGLVYNGRVNDEHDKYATAEDTKDADALRKNTEDYMATRNLLYILGVIGLGGFSLTLLF